MAGIAEHTLELDKLLGFDEGQTVFNIHIVIHPHSVWGAVCNIHTFVDRGNFCQDRSTFVQQKLPLSDKSNFVVDKSTFF